MTRDAAADGMTDALVAAWTPVAAVAAGVLLVAASLFLSAGFASVAHLQNALGAMWGAGPRMAPYAGALSLLVIGCGAGWLGAPGWLRTLSGLADIAHRLGWVLAIAALLAFPPTQWITFGRPDATKRYETSLSHAAKAATPMRMDGAGG